MTESDPMLPWMANVLLDVRRHAGLSYAELAERLDIDGSALNRLERAERWPRYLDETIQRYADLAGVPAVELWQRAIANWTAARRHPAARRSAMVDERRAASRVKDS
jgi:transcriptional regulator with XRE-family HTH domain